MTKFKYVIPKAELEERYVDKKMSTKELARIYGCNTATIWHRLHLYGIPIRNNSEAVFLKIGKDIPVSAIIRLYQEEGWSTYKIAREYKCSQWLISSRLKGAGVVLRGNGRGELTEFGRKILWSKENVQKRIKAQRIRPNKAELKLEVLLNKWYPRQFAYNGDFRLGVSLDKMIPDFVNVNGEKQVIELFGKYWHRTLDTSDIMRVSRYGRLGWQCLIVWEEELKDEATLKARVDIFNREGVL